MDRILGGVMFGVICITYNSGLLPQPKHEQEKAVQLVEPPKRHGKYTRYHIEAVLIANHALGMGWPLEEKLGWPNIEGFSAASDGIRQFRTADGRHVLAMYDDRYYYSLVLMYHPPKRVG